MGPWFLGNRWGSGSTPAAPGQVQNLAAAAVSPTQINLAWDATATATSYLVERSPAGAGTWASVGTPATNSLANTGLTGGTAYDYRVSAVNAGGTGTASATATATAQTWAARWGAVAHYALDEASGNALATLGGLDLTAVNAPGASAGKVSGARAISSSGTKCFTRADDALLRQGAFDFALGFWVNPTTVGADQALISKDGSTTGWHIRFTSANKILFISRQAGGADYGRVTSTAALSASTWSYVLCGVDYASALVFVSVNAGAFDTAAGTGTPGAGTAAFELGRNPSAGETVFTGALDEVTIFKPTGVASLKAEMASRLYNSGAGLVYPWS